VGKDVTDEDEDDPTETDVDLDASLISQMITVTRSGDEPLTAPAGSASGADTEPRTLEPQLVVRGLVPAYPHVPGSVEAPRSEDASTRRGGDDDDADDGDDKTTRSIDARLLEAYEAGQSIERVGTHRSTQPVATLRSPIITPSEPFRVTGAQVSEMPGSSGSQPTPRRAAPMPAAGRPPGSDPDLGEPTQKREPFSIAETEADAPDEVEDETATDAMRARRIDTIDIEEGEAEEEEDETRTRQDVGGVIASLPAVTRDLVGLDEARQASRVHPPSSASVPAAPAGVGQSGSGPGTPGATIRMLFNASLGAVTVDPALRDTVLRETIPPPPRQSAPPAFPPPPALALALVADPQLQQTRAHVPPPPATTVRRPPTPHFDPLAKPKRRGGRKLFYFLLLVAAFAGGFRYRYRITPWVMKRLPTSWRPSTPTAPIMVTPVAVPTPDPSATTSAPTTSASTSLDASAPSDASADASASAAPSAAPSASASHGKKRPKK
jgi:hypothetical protein